MFVEHKQLKVLKAQPAKVARLKTSSGNVQLAFPGYPPQMCGCYLVSLSSGNKVLVIVAFYLTESCQSIFYVPKRGEVPVEDAQSMFADGYDFAESMGFVLTETDYHLLSSSDQQKLWTALPICQPPGEMPAAKKEATPNKQQEPAEVQAPAKKQETAKKQKTTQKQEPVVEHVNQQDTLDEYRERSLKSLGRFLASL